MRFFAGPCSGIQSGGWDAKGGNREDTAPNPTYWEKYSQFVGVHFTRKNAYGTPEFSPPDGDLSPLRRHHLWPYITMKVIYYRF